jgi:dihydrofolate reductase
MTTVYIATSLDGFIARPDGAIDWLGEPDGYEDYGWAAFISAIDAIVMGRTTFEQVLGFDGWPYEGTPLTVLSTTMTHVPEQLRGKAEVSSLHPRELLAHLAARGCQRVYVDGGKTIQSFLREDLIDELVITTLPVLIGQGIPLFGRLGADMTWNHVSTKTFEKGLVKNHYRRVGR